MDHSKYIRKTIRLAKRGTGRVSPNPRVGCVIVRQNKIIAEGYHQFYGGPHAEVNAIQSAPKELLSESVLYVNLEPCSHYGKTPPCTDLIIQSGITKVIIGTEDPNPLVKGKGIARLRSHHIQVEVGFEQKKCFQLNEMFFHSIVNQRPFITIKSAQTLDGFIATNNNQSKWITGESSRHYVHHLRREHDAVLIGINTLLHDDSQLTVRTGKHRNPKRIVLDSKLRIPLSARILKLNDILKTIIVTTSQADREKIQAIKDMGAQVWIISTNKEGCIDIDHFLEYAWQQKLSSIFIEGGSQIYSEFIQTQYWNKYIGFIAPKLFGRGLSPFYGLEILDPQKALSFCDIKWHRRGEDIIFEGRRCSQD